MTKDQAIKKILLDYLRLKNMSLSEFSRKSNTSKAFLSKILNDRVGKYGISITYMSLIAKGMNLDEVEFQGLIKEYQDKENDQNNLMSKKSINIAEIKNILEGKSEDEIEIIHYIISNSNIGDLQTLQKFLRSMN